MAIDWQAIAKAGGIGKGRTVRQCRQKAKRDDAKRLKEFRDQVWNRCRVYEWVGNEVALCAGCGVIVERGPDVLLTGEVHHRISRRHKATRYDPSNGVILCNFLRKNCHARVKELDV